MNSNPSPMLRLLTLPASWLELLQPLRPVFARSSTFGLFVLLATGLVARTARRTVVGMLAGAGVAALVSFHCACRFFSQYRLGHRSARARGRAADRAATAAGRRFGHRRGG